MKYLCALSMAVPMLTGLVGCNKEGDSTGVALPSPTTEVQSLRSKVVLDLEDVKTNPSAYEWFDFRPNLKKLILSGAAETEHVAILWYTVADGAVGLHYHSKTESVYVIGGSQTDAKGSYPTGTVYFNPPGSGHAITNSSGFFILAYASPPNFKSTDLIREYTPVRIDTLANLTGEHAFEAKSPGVRTFEIPLEATGGMSGQFIDISDPAATHDYAGNYVLVLKGSCAVDGMLLGEQMLVVARSTEPEAFKLRAAPGSACLAMGVSF